MHTDLVIDADGHCNEPWEDLTPWMPKAYHHRAPVGFTDRHGTSRMYVEGRLSTRTEGLGPGVSGPFAPHIKGDRPGGRDARLRLPDMDQEGVDVAVIFGTRVALAVNGLRDKELAGVLCGAVNRWLLEEYLPVDPKRLKGVGLIPCQDPPAAVKELERLVQHRKDGIVSAMLPVNVYGINLGDRRFDPIYELAEAVGMPLAVHPQTGHDGQYGVWGTMGAGSERMEKYSYVHMTAFTFEPMIALMHMIGEGVFDRYPRLRVTYVEGACGWLPFWTQRLDEHFEKLRPQWHLCQRKPSEIIASGQVALTCEPEEESLPYVLETMGSHLIMYASDYPHWDCEFPESVRMLASIPGLTEEQKRRVLGRNAIQWFGLTPDELPETSVYFQREAELAARRG
jgi:uncharacterized protein